jgi:hypothetical protein
MLNAEPFLSIAVALHVREALGADESQVNVEAIDDFVPQNAGEYYIAITPEGVTLGGSHRTSGGVFDLEFGCRITVYQRTRDVPRDMRRSVYLDQVRGINAKLDRIVNSIDWKPEVINTANLLLREQDENALGFMNMLRLVSIDSKPRSVIGDTYGANIQSAVGSDNYVGLSRGVYFGGARRIERK